MSEHDFQPVEVDGKTIPQCSRCGHRWYGKGESKKPCVDTITVTINGRAVVFERINSPRSIVYANGDIRLATDGTIHMAIVGDVGSGITSDHQSAIDSLINRANEWAPVLRELARLGGEE